MVGFPDLEPKERKTACLSQNRPFPTDEAINLYPSFLIFSQAPRRETAPALPALPLEAGSAQGEFTIVFRKSFASFLPAGKFWKTGESMGKKVSRGLNGHAPACNRVSGESFNYTLGSGGRYSFPLPCLPFSLGKEECLFSSSAFPRRPDCRND